MEEHPRKVPETHVPRRMQHVQRLEEGKQYYQEVLEMIMIEDQHLEHNAVV